VSNSSPILQYAKIVVQKFVHQINLLHLFVSLFFKSGHIECVKWLLSNRAKVDVKDINGRSPLDLAEEYQHAECIQLLKVMSKYKLPNSVPLSKSPTYLEYKLYEY